MKKLQQKVLALGANTALTRTQQKNVLGGEKASAAFGCNDLCNVDADCPGNQRCYLTTFDNGNKCKRCIEPGIND
ncbi:MAG TPA: hypothetical protein VM802_24140 [Chitinophaga sp.]|uniref:hypothetical protein n=1 Tax=Chitinophaga sp. TaxID=1869181 RepID=UPI002C89006C|nr:hypothetical protein [Chitinophaga sp.]HVI47980.1 hypothetical protein [Chitinophaga sp.]